MAYDEALAERLRELLKGKRGLSEKRMFGGLAFMMRGNMLCGVVGEDLMVRTGPEAYEKALRRAHVREMDFTGRPLKGMVYVAAEGVRTKKQLESWVDVGLAYVSTLPAK